MSLVDSRNTKGLIENYLYLTDNESDKRFYLTNNQSEIIDNLDYNLNNIIFKERQTGISTLLCAWSVVRALCSDKDSPEHIVIMSCNWICTQLLQEKIVKFIQMIPNFVWGVPIDEKLFKKCAKQKIELFNGTVFTFISSNYNNVRGLKQPTIIINDTGMIAGCEYNSEESAFTYLIKSSMNKDKLRTVFVVESGIGNHKSKISLATEKVR